MMLSEKLLTSMISDLDRYPNHKLKRKQLDGLKDICDRIETGKAAKEFKKRFGHRFTLPQKINTSTVELARLQLNLCGPSRSSVNRNPLMRQYISAREDERLNRIPVKKGSSRASIKISNILAQIHSFEDRNFIAVQIQEGLDAIKELRLLKRQLSKFPSLAISLEELKGEGSNSRNEAKNKDQISLPDHLDSLRNLLGRLTDEDVLERFDLKFDGSRVKGGISGNQALVHADEIEALRASLKPII
ncbi:hypothetical protein ACFO5Q_16840 [Kordiimonas lipolytica]|uniref:Endonuclease MutS2 n=1 Tax=Kordiimonas lipolytica TaxID=1662421 RepID=A0ABV8UE36_9PROT|nr:hypothetical protein [Kordiimonas lipolytica]